MTVKQIVKQWLAIKGYDGLCDEYADCGCQLSDLMPCSVSPSECKAGYKVACTDKCVEEHGHEIGGWHIQGKKPEDKS